MSASAAGTGRSRVGRWLEAAVRLARASLPEGLPLGMAAVVGWQLPNLYWSASAHRVGLAALRDPRFDLLSLVGTALELWLIGALMWRQRARARGERAGIAAALRASARRLGRMLPGAVLATGAVVAGLLLLVIPGISLAVCCGAVWLPVMLLEDPGPGAALVRSVRLMRGRWWQALAALVISLLLFLVGAIVLGAIIQALGGLFDSHAAARAAIDVVARIGFGAVFVVYVSALQLVLYSEASSSA